MRLQPRAIVPEHADINYHWFKPGAPAHSSAHIGPRCNSIAVIRSSIWPRARRGCFDNWRRHRVDNPTDDIRIHLVADTSGTSSFWQFVAQSDQPGVQQRQFSYDAARTVFLADGARWCAACDVAGAKSTC